MFVFVCGCVCVQRDVCRGWSGLNQIISESTLHVLGGASPVCGGGVAGCCRGKPSVYGGGV